MAVRVHQDPVVTVAVVLQNSLDNTVKQTLKVTLKLAFKLAVNLSIKWSFLQPPLILQHRS